MKEEQDSDWAEAREEFLRSERSAFELQIERVWDGVNQLRGGRPTPEDWSDLIDRAVEASAAGRLDLVVVDPLASFLPGRCESDAASLLEALRPLHRLTAAGMAVLLLHHPRKKKSEAGCSARGSGALLGFVDTSVELSRYSPMPTDACQFFYECGGCHTLLKPKAGDCCVFCSYGDVPCPPIQESQASGTSPSCCATGTGA